MNILSIAMSILLMMLAAENLVYTPVYDLFPWIDTGQLTAILKFK